MSVNEQIDLRTFAGCGGEFLRASEHEGTSVWTIGKVRTISTQYGEKLVVDFEEGRSAVVNARNASFLLARCSNAVLKLLGTTLSISSEDGEEFPFLVFAD